MFMVRLAQTFRMLIEIFEIYEIFIHAAMNLLK